jgi:hypothetical protein
VTEPFDSLVGQNVVLDTAGPFIYLGRLISYSSDSFLLADADVHNTEDGHAPREQYITEAARDGIRPNRTRVFILRASVVSVSSLDEVIKD